MFRFSAENPAPELSPLRRDVNGERTPATDSTDDTLVDVDDLQSGPEPPEPPASAEPPCGSQAFKDLSGWAMHLMHTVLPQHRSDAFKDLFNQHDKYTYEQTRIGPGGDAAK